MSITHGSHVGMLIAMLNFETPLRMCQCMSTHMAMNPYGMIIPQNAKTQLYMA